MDSPHVLKALTPFEHWWMNRLAAGSQIAGKSWMRMIPCAMLIDDYLINTGIPTEQTRSLQCSFGSDMHRICPGLRRIRRRLDPATLKSGDLQWFYLFPALAVARLGFELITQTPINWGET